MNPWKEFLNSLDTPGGHVLILLVGLGLLFAASKTGWAPADKYVGEVVGALLYALKGDRTGSQPHPKMQQPAKV